MSQFVETDQSICEITDDWSDKSSRFRHFRLKLLMIDQTNLPYSDTFEEDCWWFIRKIFQIYTMLTKITDDWWGKSSALIFLKLQNRFSEFCLECCLVFFYTLINFKKSESCLLFSIFVDKCSSENWSFSSICKIVFFSHYEWMQKIH